MTNAVCVYDFTLSHEVCSIRKNLHDWLKEECKHFCYQLEEGESTGFKHFQGRISLKLKKRKTELIKMCPIKMHFSPTSNENKDNDFYVLKSETRIEGPWSDLDKELHIPRQIRDITLYKWQQKIVDSKDIWDPRTINMIIDPSGNHGKSILATFIGVHKIGRTLPYVNDFKDLSRMVMDTPKCGLYIIDIPRGIPKTQMNGFFSGVEQLKNGYAYDDRYKFHEEYFDCPIIWIFSNKVLASSYLSQDRWTYWRFKDDDSNDIEKYSPLYLTENE